MPEARLAAGVKVAVRVVLVGLARALRVPLVAVTSTRSNPTGASENVKVMVAVAPAFRVVTDDAMVTVGATVSMVMAGDDPAPPGLPTASV